MSKHLFLKSSFLFILLVALVTVFSTLNAKVETTNAKKIVFEPNLKADKKVVHPPYAWGDCSLCHTDPKGQTSELIMDTPNLCYQCHDQKQKEGKKFVHGPVVAGACTACHNPHESENSTLLVEPSINALCTSCHEAKHTLFTEKSNIHPPVADSCVNCHDPHTEDHKYQLKAEPKMDLCLMCHADKKEHLSQITDKHGAIDRPNKCQECHDPHGTNTERMLKKDTIKDMCLSCHNEKLKTDEDGYELDNLAKHLKQNKDAHGPILWNDCAACHNPHGSNNHRMLKEPFPRTFYAKFDKDNLLCFKCHESDRITEQKTKTATNFRNGEKNIHWVHVAKDEKGRTCRACHDFHATEKYPKHLRDKTKFGKINFPLRYIPTETGGSCAPACHARRHYDRVTPKINLK